MVTSLPRGGGGRGGRAYFPAFFHVFGFARLSGHCVLVDRRLEFVERSPTTLSGQGLGRQVRAWGFGRAGGETGAQPAAAQLFA